MLKKHLLEGVKKGAFDDAEATRRFEAWMKQNEEKTEARKSGLEKSQDDELDKRIAAEKKVNEARAARLAKKQADLAAKAEASVKAIVAEEQPETDETPVEGENPPEAAAEEKPQE